MPQNKKDSFVRDVGHSATPGAQNYSPIASNANAQLLEQAGGMALDAIGGYEDAKLLGQNKLSSQDAESVKGRPADTRLNEAEAIEATKDDLNLRRVENMRRQGVISHDTAKVLASKAVAAASARMPGRAAEYRKQAAAFFGDFGEGQGLLDMTQAEKDAAKEDNYLKHQMMGDGYFIPSSDGRMLTTEVPDLVKAFRDMRMTKTTNENRRLQIGVAFEEGKLTAAQIETFGSTIAQDEVQSMFRLVAAKISSNEKIDSATLTPMLLAAKVKAEKNLNSYIAKATAAGKPIPSSDAQVLRKSLETQFKHAEDLIASQHWTTLLKDRGAGLKNMIELEMYARMPELAGISQVLGPEVLNKYLQSERDISTMTPNQQANYFQLNPSLYNIRQQGKLIGDMGEVLKGMVRGWMPDPLNDPSRYNIARQTGINILTDPKLAEADPTKVEKVGDSLINSWKTTNDPQISDALAMPGVRLNLNDKQVDSILNHSANLITKSISEIVSGTGIDVENKSNILFNKKTNRFEISGEALAQDDPLGRVDWGSVEARSRMEAAVDNLNKSYRLLKNYETTPMGAKALGGKPAQDVVLELVDKAKEHGEMQKNKATNKQTNTNTTSTNDGTDTVIE